MFSCFGLPPAQKITRIIRVIDECSPGEGEGINCYLLLLIFYYSYLERKYYLYKQIYTKLKRTLFLVCCVENMFFLTEIIPIQMHWLRVNDLILYMIMIM